MWILWIPPLLRLIIAALEVLCAVVILWRFRFKLAALAPAAGLLMFAGLDALDGLGWIIGEMTGTWLASIIPFYGVILSLLAVLGALLFTVGLIPLGLASLRPNEGAA